MKSKSLFSLIFASALVVAIISGCSTAKISADNLQTLKSQQPPQGKALVYIVRPSGLGYAINFAITCDGRAIGSTSGKRFVYTFLDPGTHKFISSAENKSELFLDVKANQTYFIKQDVEMGIWKARNELIRIDDSPGREALDKCKLSGDCIAYTSGK